MNIPGIGLYIVVVLALFLLALVARKAFRNANSIVTDDKQATRDMQLETSAQETLVNMANAYTDDKSRLLIMMLANDQLPSYVTQEVIDAGPDAVAQLIEQTIATRRAANIRVASQLAQMQ